MTGWGSVAAGNALVVEMADERTSAAKADGSHAFSSIVSRAAGSPSTIDLEETMAGQAARSRSMTTRDLPGVSGPKRKPRTSKTWGSAPTRLADEST